MEDNKQVLFNEKGETVWKDCCKDCGLFECPANETRCQ